MTEAIVLETVNKHMGKRQVLKDISFSVSHGDIFGYLGPNGAGKTTTMRITLGLLKPTSGKALVRGSDLSGDAGARSKVGVLFEKDGVYDRISAWDNMNYYAQLYNVPERQKKITDLLELSGLFERRNDKVGQFSRGMKRKLGLARALLHEPEVLFLDEPSAGLDPEAQKMVRDLLVRLSDERKLTIFLNSHDLDEVQRICSKAAIIQNGTIKAYDTMENLRGKTGETIVRITFPNRENTNKACDLLDKVDFTTLLNHETDTIVTASLSKNKQSSDLLELLIGSGIKVNEITNQARSLEDIYLEIIKQEKTNA